ncbi:hypothetical protein [Actinoplanes sp. NPDC051851]|uniref:hypothetical protein n=1 Tax=Actinoplanes sp. NPDC051851 TaxID=3154753 RepID=UPI003425613A
MTATPLDRPLLADSVRLTDRGVEILDRRVFPFERSWVVCPTVEDVAVAIEQMVTQSSGPLFAATAGFVLATRSLAGATDPDHVRRELRRTAQRLIATRPTNNHIREGLAGAVAALDADLDAASLLDRAAAAAAGAADGYLADCRALGAATAAIIPDGARVLTHCWADSYLVETVMAGRAAGKSWEFVCTETRPYLQGARLTGPSLVEMGVPTTLVTDGMVAETMRRGMVDVALTAADRVTMDGHVVNKVGTLAVALAAREFGLPFHAMVIEPDPAAPGIDAVPIELRDPDEVLSVMGVRTAGEGLRGFYPAFDVTPPHLITTVVTRRGAFAPDKLIEGTPA